MNQREDIVKIAQAELGYREGASNYTKYGQWYGLPYDPWCAMFVSWCAAQAKVETSVIPRFAYVPSGVSFFRQQGRWQPRGNGYRPLSGDLVFYGGSGSTGAHVGIVERVEGNLLYALEGNTSAAGNTSNGDGVYRRQRNLNDSWIMGYGQPAYKEEDDMNRYQNIEDIPEYGQDIIRELVDKELLKGKDDGLDLNEDMLRVLVIVHRMINSAGVQL